MPKNTDNKTAESANERAYLNDLLTDFAARQIDVDQALYLIRQRYDSLQIERFSRLLNIEQEQFYQATIIGWIRDVHAYMYDGIFSNAGSFRLTTDPNGGFVSFGGDGRFTGYSPTKISEGVAKASANLLKIDPNPIRSALTFYQQFVMVHPFYDANGRIGRFVLDVYLDFHGYYLSWEGLSQNRKWLKRLNDCHVRFGSDSYDEYLGYLVQHWQKYILLKSDILPPELS